MGITKNSKTKKSITWVEKYNSVDMLTRLSMLAKALSESNEYYTYGQLQQLKTTDPQRFSRLERMALDNKRDAQYAL